ncbi:universal stress protein, partial [Methylobacterium frigidaeris]
DRLKARQVVIAWKDSPEARRAVTAALPFITHAKEVFVLSAGGEARFQGAEEVAEHLAQHRAHVTTHLLDVPGHDVADELLRFTARQTADLIVMGGYGHSRLREWLFGGVTRTILEVAPVCCLMSH